MKNLVPALSALSLLVSLQACASDDDGAAQVGSTQGGAAGFAGNKGDPGGTGGAGGAGKGQGGSSACGMSSPSPKSECTTGDTCTYGDVLAICESDGWFVGRRATAAALATDTACKPIGKWQLAYHAGTKTGMFCTKPYEPDLEIRALPSGVLLASFLEGEVTISSDGCTISASTSQSHKNPSESWSSSTTIDLKLSGDAGTGTYTKANGGFCNGQEKGDLTATRL